MTYAGAKGQAPHQYRCHVCGEQLRPHERAEGFCDACLKKAQTQPLLSAEKGKV